jgi:hypothetical protein
MLRSLTSCDLQVIDTKSEFRNNFQYTLNKIQNKGQRLSRKDEAASNRVHEGSFDVVEEQDAEEKNDQGDGDAVQHVQRVETAGAKTGVPESLDDGRHGIDQNEPAIVLRDGIEGINDWFGVHEELDAKPHKLLQVSVSRGERRNDDAPAKAKSGHNDQMDGYQQEPHV